MALQHAEDWNLGMKSMSMRRQALIREVVSVPQRYRLASILVVLLTGTLLLGTPAFGGPVQVTDPEGYPLPEPDPGCVIEYDEDSKRVIQVCDSIPLNRPPPEGEVFAMNHPPCKADDRNGWWAVKRMCTEESNRENLERCEWRYTNPYYEAGMWLWKKHTQAEWVICVAGELHACGGFLKGWIGKKLVKWLWPKITTLAYHPPCLESADIEWACEQYATQQVCRGRTWRGEGTIQFDFVDNDSLVEEETQTHQQLRMDGPFTITFGIKEGTIQGEGSATLTLAAKLLVGGESPGQCTLNGRDTVPMSVSGMYENGKLKLMFDSSFEDYHITASCSGKLSPAIEWFRSRMYVEALYHVFFDKGHPLVVVWEEGAEGRLVEDLSEPDEAPGTFARSFSIRIKSRPDH